MIGTLVKCYNLVWALNPCKIVDIKNGSAAAGYASASTDIASSDSGSDSGSSSDGGLLKYSQIVFATLEGHLITGEERFRVTYEYEHEYHHNDTSSGGFGGSGDSANDTTSGSGSGASATSSGDVYFDLFSFTKGSPNLLGLISMPFIRPLQKRFFREQSMSMKRYMGINVDQVDNEYECSGSGSSALGIKKIKRVVQRFSDIFFRFFKGLSDRHRHIIS